MSRYAPKIWVVVLLLLSGACTQQTSAVVPTLEPTALVPAATDTPVLPDPTPTPVVYVVRPGDSLSAIALRFGVPTEKLVEANGIENPNLIEVGQKLVVPGPTSAPTPTAPPTITPTPNVPPQLEIVDVIGRGAVSAETVIVLNQSRGVLLDGWTLRDGQGSVYVFPSLYLGTGIEVRVHTGSGENSPRHLYWNRETAVWGEAGDVAILADERGVIYARKPLD